MAKKALSEGIEAILKDTRITKVSSHSEGDDRAGKTSKYNDKSAELVRTSVQLSLEMLKKLRAVSYWERKSMKTVIEEAVQAFFADRGDAYMQEACDAYRGFENN